MLREVRELIGLEISIFIGESKPACNFQISYPLGRLARKRADLNRALQIHLWTTDRAGLGVVAVAGLDH